MRQLLNGELVTAHILRPGHRSQDFPDGFGVSLSPIQHRLRLDEWILRDPDSIIRYVRQWGFVSLLNTRFEIPPEDRENNGVMQNTVNLEHGLDEALWHSDGDDGQEVILLGQQGVDTGRDFPTIAAPTVAVIQAIQAEARATLKSTAKTKRRMRLQNLHDFLADPDITEERAMKEIELIDMREDNYFRRSVLGFLRRVNKRASGSIATHDWSLHKYLRSVCMIYTKHDQDSLSSVLHAALAPHGMNFCGGILYRGEMPSS